MSCTGVEVPVIDTAYDCRLHGLVNMLCDACVRDGLFFVPLRVQVKKERGGSYGFEDVSNVPGEGKSR